jgi:hypothetical protein
LLVLGLVAVITLQHVSLYPAVSQDTPFAGVLNYEWKFLSAEERAAVEKSIEIIRHQRIKNVTLNIVDDSGKPYTGPVQITQDSTSFVFMVGDSDWPVKGMQSEYIALTPSRSIYVYQPSWRYVQPTENAPIDFSYAQYDINFKKMLGSTDIHLIVGPDFPPPGDVAAWSETPPDWARSMSYLPFKEHLTTYVEALASRYKGIIGNYHLWDEANAEWSNRGWPMQQVVDIIRTEALTIRNIDPDAKIYVDLTNVDPSSPRNSWTPGDFIQQLLAASVPFDFVGLEAKYGAGLSNSIGGIDTLQSRLNQLARFGKPIYLWEEGFPSFIEAKYRSTRNGWCCYFWHGLLPTEERQAEYMLAEAIVTLADYPAVVAGVRFNWLADQTDSPVFPFRYMGVIYDNGTRKDAFYALRNLWGNLTINTTVPSTSGVAAFSGLAGSYTVAAEGYRPIRISVAEGATASFGLRLVPLLSTTTSVTSSAMVTTTHSAATSTHTGEISQVMNALLTTPIGNILLVALALTITIAAAIVARSRIRRSSPQQNMKGSHASAGG